VVSRRPFRAVLLLCTIVAGSGCTVGTVYHRGPAASRIEMREPRPGVIELRRGERIKITCRDGTIVRGYVVGLASTPESLLVIAVPDAEYTDDPETLEVRLREVESLWAPGRSERTLGLALFVIMIAALAGGYGLAMTALSGMQ
jgi:hypothetical protein